METYSPRDEIVDMSPYEPGKPTEEIAREYDLEEPPVKLASNENPYPPPESLRSIYLEEFERLNRYPDGGSFYLREALSEQYDWPRSGIVIGAGSDEVVDFLAKAFLRPEDEVVWAEPSFVRHRMVTRMMGATPVPVPLRDDFTLDLQAMAEAVTPETRFVCLPNPNNPTSRYVSTQEFEEFLESVPPSVTVLLDEAYFEFMDQDDYPDGREYIDHAPDQGPSIVLLRTFSKAYGLAGLRVGYALMEPERAREIHKVRPPFNVSRPAQAVARAALAEADYVEECRESILASRKELVDGLERRNLEVIPPSANFMLVEVPGSFSAEAFCEALLERGVIIRSMAPYGLEDYVRVSVGRPGENEKFLGALDTILE